MTIEPKPQNSSYRQQSKEEKKEKTHTSKFRQIFGTSCLWPWLGPPLTAMRYVMYFRLVWMTSCLYIMQRMARIRNDAYVSLSSPGGGTRDPTQYPSPKTLRIPGPSPWGVCVRVIQL